MHYKAHCYPFVTLERASVEVSPTTLQLIVLFITTPIITRTVSSELLGFCFNFSLFFRFCAVR